MATYNPYLYWCDESPSDIQAQYNHGLLERNQKDLAHLRSISRAFLEAPNYSCTRLFENTSHRIDIFRPAHLDPYLPLAAVVFVHGGRWSFNTSDDTAFWAQACLQEGWAFVAVNFPKLPQASLAEIVASVRTSIDSVFAHATALGLDAQRIALTGHSSGAHLALASAMALDQSGDNVAPWLSQLRALYCLGGMYDLLPLVCAFPPAQLGFDLPQAWQLSPVHALAWKRLPSTLPPLCIGFGAQETAAFARQSHALHSAWPTAAAPLLAHDHCAHFDSALEWNQPASATRAFMRQHLQRHAFCL